MIILDEEKYIEEIKSCGIGATDPYATQKLKAVMNDFVLNSSYKKGKIVEKVKAIAEDYFHGLPDEIIAEQLNELYKSAKEYAKLPEYGREKKILNLYKSEMEAIAALESENLQRLAFAMLVMHKFTAQYNDGCSIRYHKSVRACKSDIYRIAGLKSVSGTNRTKLWSKLAKKGMVKYFAEVNDAFRFKPSWLAMTLFTVPFNVDIKNERENEEIWMQITNYDDVMLYWRYFTRRQREDWNVVLCSDCGCPIEKTSNNNFLCSDCAKKRKQDSSRQSYNNSLVFA